MIFWYKFKKQKAWNKALQLKAMEMLKSLEYLSKKSEWKENPTNKEGVDSKGKDLQAPRH